MTRNEITRRFPNASSAFILANLDPDDSGLRPLQSKPAQRLPLDPVVQGENKSWHDAASSFEIVFTVYSSRPCDWDGYDIKALQDFLVKAGILPDDNWRILAGRVVSKKAATQGEEKTVIEITAK